MPLPQYGRARAWTLWAMLLAAASACSSSGRPGVPLTDGGPADVPPRTPDALDAGPDTPPDQGVTDAAAETTAGDARDGAAGADGGMDAAVAPGDAGTLPIAGPIAKLVADPGGGLVYGLVPTDRSALMILDVAAKAERPRVELPGVATDLAVSADGRWLVAALDTHHALAVVDKATWSVATVLVTADPARVAVTRGGQAYYVTLDQWTQLHRVDLTLASPTDTLVSANFDFQPAIQISDDGQRLYSGESAVSLSTLSVWNVGNPGLGRTSSWEGPVTIRWLYLGPRGTHLYYAGQQFDATTLAPVGGPTGQVFAESQDATWAVTAAGVLDAQLLRVVAPFPVPAAAAALAAGDTEIWWYDAASNILHYDSVADRLRAAGAP